MREHAPRSTRLAGILTAATATLAFGYAMANGMGDYIAKALPDPIIYVPLPDETPVEPPPVDTTPLETSADTLAIPDPVYVPIDFRSDEPPPIESTGGDKPRIGAIVPPQPPKPPAALVRLSPALIPGELPPYPLMEVRGNHEGISKLSVCIDPRGQVTSATLAATSGRDALDEAALRWVRKQKFTPARINGQPQAVCGHPIIYEWRITRH
jgi:protein TonB